MQYPNVTTTIKNEEKNITYQVIAYRKLSRNEMIQSVRMYHANKKSKKPKKGSVIQIHTIIGHNE